MTFRARALLAACALSFGIPALCIPAAALAQALPVSADPFTLSLSPQDPIPYGALTLTPLSSTLDLANATMAVSVNGASAYGGNAKPVAVTVGGPGAVTAIRVTITSQGQSYASTVTVEPQDVSLVAEPQSFSPALYPGKPLVPLSGMTRVVAVANLETSSGARIDPAALSYEWTVGGTESQADSGIGKSAILVGSPIEYRSLPVSVRVATQDGALSGSASLTLSASEPTMRLYVNDPLLGVEFSHALSGTYALTAPELSLYAAPFSVPLTTAPVVSWTVSGAGTQEGSTLTLRPAGSGSGSAALTASAAASAYTNATASLSLTFGSQSANFLGL